MTLQHASRPDFASPSAHVLHALCAAGVLLLFCANGPVASAQQHALPKTFTTQSSDSLTPFQRQIESERRRLSSSSTEERRDAVARLGAMGHPESSRAASLGLRDRAAIVRATAARAVISLGPADATSLLTPLLRDRDEFVRREAAYALGLTRSPNAVPALVAALENDKQPSVRGAAAVALGEIGDPRTVAPLAAKLTGRIPASGFLNRVIRRKQDEDEFVRRSSAVSLGRIGSREGVPALIEALSRERAGDDVRREAARALGLIGDPSAIPALRSVLTARDPYLSRIAYDALRKLDPSQATRPT